jgi:hypothetical protein
MTIKPPGTLRKRSLTLWKAIVENYTPVDALDEEVLFQACAASERADELRDLIKLEAGKDNVLLKHELAFRAFATRTLTRIIATAGKAEDKTPGHLKRKHSYWHGKR